MIIHTVIPGDTPQGIADRYQVPLSRLLSDNGLNTARPLVPGEELVILPTEETVTVNAGDSLYSIAVAQGVSVNELLRNNPVLRGIPTIYPGQTLAISLTGERGRNILVNGYAYPFIDEGVLRAELPYLSYLTVFTYGFREDGSLIEADDRELVQLANSYGVKALLLISTLQEDGTFNNRLSQLLFADTAVQDRLINELITVMKEKGYSGLEVDFEFIPREDAAGYVSFLTRLKQALSAEGFPLFVALAPKTSADQPGLLYEGHDYAGIGAIADYVILMTYEWGYQYGPPGAVAPIPNVERVVMYAVSEIPNEKILLGVPNYGYDWPLPFVQGETRADGIGIVEAVEKAGEVGVPIQFDNTAKAPFYPYEAEGIEHIVWFENATSVEERLKLVEKYSLAGISIWQIMRYFPQLYRVLNARYRIE